MNKILIKHNLSKVLYYFCLFFFDICHLENNNKSESNTKFLDLYSTPSVENELMWYTQWVMASWFNAMCISTSTRPSQFIGWNLSNSQKWCHFPWIWLVVIFLSYLEYSIVLRNKQHTKHTADMKTDISILNPILYYPLKKE